VSEPIKALLGVSDDAANALAQLGIKTIFDLATSRVFGTAYELACAGEGIADGVGRFGKIPGDIMDSVAPDKKVEELLMEPVDILREIGPALRTLLEQSMQIATVRDLGLWPPFHAAREILSEAYGATEKSINSEAPQDLVPDSGRYPTERVQYEVLVFDKFLKKEGRRRPPSGSTGTPASSSTGTHPTLIEAEEKASEPIIDAGLIDVGSLLSANAGFTTPALGAILTFTQSWFMRGLALGNLIHSVALAPGESTKIAMIDWSRRTAAGTSESIEEGESLGADISRNRAISEITHAVAHETQTGQSAATTLAHATQEGSSSGKASLLPLIHNVETSGTSFGTSTSFGFSTSWATSSGDRNVSADMSQNIADSTHQAAHSARTRRASIVREVSQSESERLTTRAVTNYNHMHALTVEYYEVVQLYRTILELSRATRCLFIPMKLINFQNPIVLSRYRHVIASVGLNYGTKSLSIAEPNSLAISAPYRVEPWSNYTLNQGQAVVGQRVGAPNSDYLLYPLDGIGFTLAALSLSIGGKFESAIFESTDGVARELSFQERQPSDVDPLGQARIFGKDVFPLPSSSNADERAKAIRDAEQGFLRITRIILKKKKGEEKFSGPVTVLLALDFSGDPKNPAEFDDVFMRVNVTIEIPPDKTNITALQLGHSVATSELIDHLQQNQLHYSQAIWTSLDPASLGMLLAKYTYPIDDNQVPLLELVDPVPVASVGNFLCFRAPGIDKADALKRRFAHRNREDLIPVPSGGVFAEAVLGRFNSAEKLDITRFWNWQDSPIPIQAPDIAPLQTGTRKSDEDLKPGQLGQPVLNIVNSPALPDPQGLPAVLAAVQNGNMFRDMSGLAASIGLLKEGIAGAQAGAGDAASQAGKNAEVAAELRGKIIEAAAKVISSIYGGGANASGGVSGQGAKINHGKDMDDRAVPRQAPEIPASEASSDEAPSANGKVNSAGSHTGTWEGDATDTALGAGPASIPRMFLNSIMAASPRTDENGTANNSKTKMNVAIVEKLITSDITKFSSCSKSYIENMRNIVAASNLLGSGIVAGSIIAWIPKDLEDIVIAPAHSLLHIGEVIEALEAIPTITKGRLKLAAELGSLCKNLTPEETNYWDNMMSLLR
jgi:hypothetical protein